MKIRRLNGKSLLCSLHGCRDVAAFVFEEARRIRCFCLDHAEKFAKNREMELPPLEKKEEQS